jgi:hypothetical protein
VLEFGEVEGRFVRVGGLVLGSRALRPHFAQSSSPFLPVDRADRLRSVPVEGITGLDCSFCARLNPRNRAIGPKPDLFRPAAAGTGRISLLNDSESPEARKAALVTTTTLSAWRARRIPSPDRSLLRRHGRAGERPSRPCSADTSHLDSSACFRSASGGSVSQISSEISPPAVAYHATFICSAVLFSDRGAARARVSQKSSDRREIPSRRGGASSPGRRPVTLRAGPFQNRTYAQWKGEPGRRLGVEKRPAGNRPPGVAVILQVSALLVAVILTGSAGSAHCQVVCAQIADSHSPSHDRTAEVTDPGHASCHGDSAASSEPLAKTPEGSCERGCCTVLTHGTVAPPPTADTASAASPAPTGLDLDRVRTKSDLLRGPRLAECLKSPFRFRNPPLLI